MGLDLKEILIILLIVSPLIIAGLIGASRIDWDVQTYTKFSSAYITLINHMGSKNPFAVNTNEYYEVIITSKIDVEIDQIKFLLSSGMSQFKYTAHGNITIVTLHENYFILDLKEQFNIFKKSGDALRLDIQVISSFYDTCTITIQGGIT